MRLQSLLTVLFGCALCAAAVVLPAAAYAASDEVARFGVFEAALTQTGRYDNPYTQVVATATFTRDGETRTPRTIPLFWDGGGTWRVRFSPDEVGAWRWSVRSSDPGLNGKHGTFTCTSSALKGSLQPMAGHPRHFQYQDGTPFYWFGETGWAIYTDNAEKKADREAVERYLDKRTSEGFNVVHSHLICENDLGNSGGMPFIRLTDETINPGYWQEVDHRLRYLAEKKMIAGLALAWTDKGQSKQSWQKFPDNQARLRYARYIVARYSAFPVYFIVAGEWDAWKDHLAGRVMNNAIGAQIKADDPHGRLVGIHEYAQSPQTLMQFRQAEWNDFADYQQNYQHLHESALACFSAGKPVVNSEYGYYRRMAYDTGLVNKANSADADVIRAATWDITMAGGYIVTGFGSTYFSGGRNPGPFDPNAPHNKDWETQVQHVRTFFTALPWWELEPNDALITAPLARGQDEGVKGDAAGRPPRVAYWALATPNRRYVAYLRGIPAGQPATVTLPPAGGKSWRVRRFDPRTGEYASLPDAAGGGGALTLTPPDARDWIYLVEAPEAAGQS